jgi:sugar/nucleoside kinase (ribokinase family)
MKFKGFALMPVILIVTALCIGSAAYFITKTNDSPIEQAAEAVLRAQGVDIDLSPEYIDIDYD